jgi:hypothetical protein
MNAEGYTRREQELSGWSILLETYRLGDKYFCTISSVDPGARFARAEGPTREEAERIALEKAARWLGQTRRFSVNT